MNPLQQMKARLDEMESEIAALRASIGGPTGSKPWRGNIVYGPTGLITPANDPNKCWVKPLAATGTNDTSPPVLLLCRQLVPRIGLPVTVGTLHGNQEQEVLGVVADDLALLPNYTGNAFNTPRHADSHEWIRSLTWPFSQAADDALSLGVRNLTPLRVTPSTAGSLKVDVGAYGNFGGYTGLDLSASQPASGLARFVTVYLDNITNTVKTTNGSTVADDTNTIPPKQAPSEANVTIAAYVRLSGSATEFADGDIDDPRDILASSRITNVPYQDVAAPGQKTTHDDLAKTTKVQFAGGVVAGGNDGDSTSSTATVYHDSATAYANTLPGNTDTAMQIINTEDHVSGGVQTGIVFRLEGDTLTRKTGIFAITKAAGTRAADLVFIVDDGTTRPEVFRLADDKAHFLTDTVFSPTIADTPLATVSVHKDSTTAYANAVPNATTLPFYVRNTEDHVSGGVYTGFMFNLPGDSQNRIAFFGGVSESASNRKASFVICTDDGLTPGRTEKFRLTGDGYLKLGSAGVPGSPLEIDLATEDLEIVDAGSTGATEQDWIEVQVGGVTGYIRVHATK